VNSNRSSGVRVSPAPSDVYIGTKLDIIGTAAVTGGEKTISVVSYNKTGTGKIKPLAMRTGWLGGFDWNYDELTGAGQRGITGAVGLNNIGLLVRTWGTVTETEPVTAPQKPTWFSLSDGSGEILKVRVPAGVSVPAKDSHASVTGISSCEPSGANLLRVLRIRDKLDITQ
jgi:hypothetical protein